MRTLILSTAIRLLAPLFMLFSLYILFRGHNHPGGGFIGGLIGSIVFVFHTLAHGALSTERTFFTFRVYYYSHPSEQSYFNYIRYMLLVNFLRRKSRIKLKNWEQTIFYIKPVTLMAAGLFTAATSGIISLLQNKPYMSALWPDIHLPMLGTLGTPIFFDMGVYLMVLGMVLMVVFTLSRD